MVHSLQILAGERPNHCPFLSLKEPIRNVQIFYYPTDHICVSQ